MHYVYILISGTRKKWSYVGSTSNLAQRYKNHVNGKVKSTKGYRPLFLAYKEVSDSRENAYKRELYFKTGYGREEKQKILENYYSGVVQG